MTESLLGAPGQDEVTVTTFNIRRANVWPGRAVGRWSERRGRVQALLATERPALIGLQEALPRQVRAVLEALGDDYIAIGRGRGRRGRGEGCPIVLDTSRLELLDWRQVALSERPTVAGSRSWGSLFPRVAVRALLRDRGSGATFVAVNTHLDVASGWARRRGMSAVRALAGDGDRPAIITLDANTRLGGLPLAGGEHPLLDSWRVARARLTPAFATYAAYRQPHPGRRIDGILVSPGVRVSRAAIDGRRFEGGWPSDHLPVHAAVAFGSGRS